MKNDSRSKHKNIAVIGIGRVGLPLALVFANEGYTIYGIGKDAAKIEKIQKGVMPFMETGAAALLKKLVSKKFFPTTDYSFIKKCDYIILTLGTSIDENMNPVYDQINTSLEDAIPYFKPGQTLILRGTVFPRTTQYVSSIINSNGFNVGKNFFIAFCPERIAEGKSLEEIKTIPQIIGGIDKASAKKGKELFEKIVKDTILTDDVSAELAKLFTNMYRYINFAIANEFMVLADSYRRNIYEIIHLVNYNYKRGGLNLPGLTGGPCLFKDGFFLISDLPFSDLIFTSWKINESIPLLLVKRIRERTKLEGKKVALLGLGFKAEIDDIRESLSFKVRKAFLRERAIVTLHDPYITQYPNQTIEKDIHKALAGADVIFIATKHRQYQSLNIQKIKKLAKKDCIVCDIWNVFKTGRIVYKLNYLEENGTIKNV